MNHNKKKRSNGSVVSGNKRQKEVNVSEVEYEVSRISAHKQRKGERLPVYLVHWVGYETPTWEHKSNVQHLELYQEYLSSLKMVYLPYSPYPLPLSLSLCFLFRFSCFLS